MRIQENVPPLPLKKLQRRNTDGKLKDESLFLSLFALDVFPAELFFFLLLPLPRNSLSRSRKETEAKKQAGERAKS